MTKITPRLAAGAAVALAIGCGGGNESEMTDNPFLSESPLHYHLPPFDRIEDAHFRPAFEAGMEAHLAEVEAIAASGEAPTFENTLVALERSGRLLDRVARTFFSLASADTNEEINAIRAEMAPRLAAHTDAVLLDADLFRRVETLYERRADLGLSPEEVRLVERHHRDFTRAGARLTDPEKERMRKINAELASLSAEFSDHTLDEVNASAIEVETADELAGLSEGEIAAAAEAAKERGAEGRYVLALLNTSGQPALASLEDRALRERIMKASLARGSSGGEHDNREVIVRIAALRAERAALLGYSNHAAFVLEEQTAKTLEAVDGRLAGLTPAAVANARRERDALAALARAEGDDLDIAAWDWSYYTEKLRAERFDFDESQLKPYFEMNGVLENGVFHAASGLYGLRFEERPDLPAYHPDVRIWEVFEEDGAPLGLFLGDFYARPSKRGGAWMNAYVPQSGLFGTKPVVANHLNIPKPPEGEPTLLTFDEVITLFHEFGHALHGLFSAVRYPTFSGTSVPRDFVEYPSQVNEMWATWPEVLQNYAVHHETGEPIPADLLERVLSARTFNQGFATTEYLAATLLDLAWHRLTPPEVPEASEALAFEESALEAAGAAFAPVPPRYRSTYFSHIWSSGYSAGYYSYIWSEVLDADSVEWFRENGGLTRENGDHFRRTLLSKGGSVEAMDLYRAFRGRDAEVEHLLKRRGLGG